MAIINGVPEDKLAVTDRGLNYGDGVFTTALIERGDVQLWSLHQQRLDEGLQRLVIDFGQWQALSDCVKQQAMTRSQAIIKVMITRGSGGRGYTPPDSASPNWLVSLHEVPQHYEHWQSQGIALAQSSVKLAKQPLLAGIKHLNRLEQVLVKQELATLPQEDVLVCDTDGVMVESSMANLFWHADGQWYTPDLSLAGVAGVMRRHILTQMADEGMTCHRVRQMPMMLAQAEAAFICNSIMGMVPLTAFETQAFNTAPVWQLKEELGLE